MNYAEGTFERAGELLGKDVIVTLDDKLVVKGRLIVFDDMGGCKLVDEGGAIHDCWPLLKIEEDPPPPPAPDQRYDMVVRVEQVAADGSEVRRMNVPAGEWGEMDLDIRAVRVRAILT